MTQAEYDLCRDIKKLEAAALATRAISERRFRLFALGCTLRVLQFLTRPAIFQVIESALLFADGLATNERLHEGWLAVRDAASKAPSSSKWDEALRVVLYATTPSDKFSKAFFSDRVAVCVCRAIDLDENSESYSFEVSETYQREMARCCEMFRDLFPYHAPHQPSSPPHWTGGDVAHVARAIYEENRFEDMPVLADALEDAGCDDLGLIAHCRQTGLHIRGCWAVDLTLGMK